MRRLLLIPLASVLLAVGCGSADKREVRPDDATAFRPEVAPLTSASAAPDEVAAREHLTAGRYDEAHDAFSRLATYESDPNRRAEFLFFAAEAALGAGEHEEAYEAYRRLLRRFPSTPRYPLVVERIFLIGRLYAEGKATTTTWFFGMEMNDRSLGVEILEEFQRARERHPLADDALHAIGLARVAQEEFGLAIDAWQKLIDEYPRSEWAETAEFKIATTYVLMSDGTDYDKRPLLTALQRLRRYIERHPTGNHVAEAREEVARLEEGLAAHKVDVARFYLRRDRNYSATLALEEVLRDFPRTAAAKDAARLKAGLTGVKPPEPKQHQEDEDDGPRPGSRRPPPPDLPPGMFPQPVD